MHRLWQELLLTPLLGQLKMRRLMLKLLPIQLRLLEEMLLLL
jgi:hypothetical protein